MVKRIWENIPMWVKVFTLCLAAGAIFWLSSCSAKWLKYYPQDNILEEAVEEVIEKETGLDVDLSPFSKEHVPIEYLNLSVAFSKIG